MNEAVIFQSPHAIKPKIYLTKAEREERYRTRLDETFRPYTVLDVLTRVYRHRPEADLDEALGKNLGAFVSLERGNSVSRAWVADCRIIRVETLFFQPLDDFLVELCVQAAIRMEIVRSGRPDVKRTKTLNRELRLQYRFDLRPCKLTCQFTGVIVNKADSLLALNPDAIRADKYFLPILREEDYPDLARMLMSMDGVPKGALLDAEALIKGMGLKLFQGVFPENGVMGEIYFSFGLAKIVDPDTGEVREAKIKPGTVLINRAACTNKGMYNGTLLHEGSHFLLAFKHFLLQMTHGHQYCSYLCKRRGQRRQGGRLTPVDIMEIQANKLPGYLMIDEESGRKKAEELLNPRFYPVIFGLPDDADWQDEKNWYKANPSLGHTITIDKVRDAYRKALETPADENMFRQLRLNQWVKQSVRWMPMDKWDECGGVVEPYELEGKACYAGLDLSSTSDLTTLVLVFPPEDGDDVYTVLPFFWLPEDTLDLRVRRDHVMYDVWKKQGFIQTTEGNVVHYGFIEQFICQLGECYNIREIAYDRWNATMMVQALEDDGFTMIPFGQGFKDMSPPTKELMRLVLERHINHGGHPVLRWNMDNAFVRTDPAGNLKIDKEKSTEKVDGAVALVMALDRAMKNQGSGSVYDERGLLFI